MNDDHPPSGQPVKKSWASRLLQSFSAEPNSREDIVEIIHEAEHRDVIDTDTKEMIEGVLDVAELRVRDIMIPRSQMVTIDKNQAPQEFLPLVIETQHSRYPVVSENKDHIEGILLAKDLIPYGFGMKEEPFSIECVMRPAVIVPESKRVDALLKEFQSKRYHMAIVVDEYGGVSGLVTIEDVLEEIVGDIEDETDEDEDKANIRKISASRYAVNALTPIEDFNEFFKSAFSDDEHDTVGGLIAQAFGHLPDVGESVSVGQFQFKITAADRRRIQQLHVFPLDGIQNELE